MNLPYFFITKSASTMADKKTKKGVVLMGTTPFFVEDPFYAQEKGLYANHEA